MSVIAIDEVEQVALGRQDCPVAAADRRSDVLRLTGLLGNDDLIGHVGCPDVL
jgi:hypothetical protein